MIAGVSSVGGTDQLLGQRVAPRRAALRLGVAGPEGVQKEYREQISSVASV